MSEKLKVFVADDSFLVRERLCGLLSILSEIEIVGQAGDARQALTSIRHLKPHAVVLDIHMPNEAPPQEATAQSEALPVDAATVDAAAVDTATDGVGRVPQNGIEVLRALKHDGVSPFVVMLSNYHFAQYREQCVAAGADAFLHKTKEFERVAEVLLQFARQVDDPVAQNGTAPRPKSSPAPSMPGFKSLPHEIKSQMRVPYGLRAVPLSSLATLLPNPRTVQAGDVLLVRVEKMGRNQRLELTSGRLCNLHEGDVLAVVVGNRYATEQFEGYADIDGHFCDLLSMGGLCGLVKSKHAGVSDPTRLRLLGALGDESGQPLRLRDFALPTVESAQRPRTIVVCGTSMDSGKTYTAFSLIFGLQSQGHRVGAYKLTGTAAGRDTWSMLDAGAYPVLDFVDGGYPSTFLCRPDELLDLHDLLGSHVAAQGADWAVVEIADGLLQTETAALLQSPRFTSTVDVFLFAAGDPLAASGGVAMLRSWGLEPLALSGRFTMSPLSIEEAAHATGLPCFTARSLQRGDLNERLVQIVGGLTAGGSPPLRPVTPTAVLEAAHSALEAAHS